MKALRISILTGGLLGGTVAPATSSAWDSICYRFKDPTAKVSELVKSAAIEKSRGCEGIEAARGRWRDVDYQLDEHRRIFELAVSQAGLPKSVLETQNLAVLTGDPVVQVSGAEGDFSSIDVKTLETAQGAAYRSFTLDEFAQLPDFSFGLWDWARGNEKCPLQFQSLPAKYSTPQACHTFKSHMGAVNSHHFPPQSDQWAAHYHELAMTRASQCRTQRADIWNAEPMWRRSTTDARLAAYFRACEVEALAYEAVGQHFLQDSWSAGHMWQRWGSTTLEDFPSTTTKGMTPSDVEWNKPENELLRKLVIAEITAVAAGTIHGSDGPIFEYILKEKNLLSPFHDPMCYPHWGVSAVDNGQEIPVVGDLHLHDVVGGPPEHKDISPYGKLDSYDVAGLAGQKSKLLTCAAGSVGTVYAALADAGTYGAPVLGAADGEAPPFDAVACKAPAATNRAMARGIDFSNIFPTKGAKKAAVISIPDEISTMARNDYGELRIASYIIAGLQHPHGTDLSRLYHDQTYSYKSLSCNSIFDCKFVDFTPPTTLYTMLGVQPNRCYSTGSKEGCTKPPLGGAELSSFVDPQLPEPLPTPDPEDRTGALALAFHMSRAPALCDTVTFDQLAALPDMVAGTKTAADRMVACQACAEWTAPFLRVGKNEKDYDTDAEPLCHFAAAKPAIVSYVYEPAVGTADPMALARRHCGCRGLVAVTDEGLKRLDVTVSTSDVALKQTGKTVPVGKLPRDVAAASDGRLLVSNGEGQIVGVRDDAEIDLDNDALNGMRLSFDGVTTWQGIAVVNVAGKELVLAATPTTGELIAWDLGAKALCERFSVAQVAGQGAYDVVVSADLAKVWVSLRKVDPFSGALASLSLPALAKCNGTAQATIAWLAPPGAASGLQPMALSPDGSRLAVGGRLYTTCMDQVNIKPDTPIDVEVGCDRVYVLDVATNTWKKFAENLSMPTRPGRYPAGVAWFGDSLRLAFSTFQGIDVGGAGDSGWPMGGKVSHLPIGGTLRLADTSGPSYEGGGGNVSRYWTYNMPLDSQVIGPTVVVDGGGPAEPGWVFVGTLSGRVSAFAVEPPGPPFDPMWEGSDSDPETTLHISTSGSWYGGCSHACELPGFVCPDVCPDGDIPGGFTSLELGSGIRVLAAY